MSEHEHENPKRETRWHHLLHPSVQMQDSGNGFPVFIRNYLHPTYVTLTIATPFVSPVTGTPRRGKTAWHNFLQMRRIEYWNISWWVAMAFTIGSIVWVINGFAVFLPHCNSHFQKADNSSGWTAWLGATVFEAGSICGMWEAWNRDDVANFGWGVHQALRSGKLAKKMAYRTQRSRRMCRWYSFDTKYFHEVGFLAAFFQLCAASIFWISGFTAIPTIQSAIMSRTGLLDGVFWTPQVVGGSGFIISATLMMLEVQRKWYWPAPSSLGWQVGFWNLIGGIGFTLSGAFGYAAASHSGADYQSSLATFWGGWAFLIGSVVQWYESVNPV
ncbi:hypothetical protein BD779DRAFT_1614490 [Infundibulicybe gibba]|nr:hypothetical protein BD779DRAFT_1614490 [Infundibulicybe gibba]